MKSDNPIKHFAFAFVIALLIYFVAYSSIEHRRTRKGPWQVTFTKSSNDEPRIIINQPKLGLKNVEILFAGATSSVTNVSTTLQFGQPRPVPYEVPFGRCVFMDTTFLPGTLTFQFFGHEIELLPRVLIVDHQEHPWHSESTLTLGGGQTEKNR
jgi:hypothetical protein